MCVKNCIVKRMVRALKRNDVIPVFCEYRESVNLVHCLLLQCRPLIKPHMFVGQGASGKDGKTVVSQKQQMRVMRNFREGLCNVLVATCVAEEGLDVGSVDLIICFDISTKSPVRLVQRCGRTGRERGGQVFILVTEGREHQTLLECMRQRDGLNKKVLQSKEVENNLYKLNPRMIPHDFTPQCQKMFITVEKKQDPKEKSKEGTEKAKKGQKDLRTMLLSKASTSSSGSSNKDMDSGLITENEFKEMFPEGYCGTTLFAKPKEYWAMNRETIKDLATSEGTELKLTKWLEWQRTLQKTVNIQHSRDSEILSELLQYSDAKRFEMPPSTQNPCFGSQELHSQTAIFMSPAKSKQPAIFTSPAKSIQSNIFMSPAKLKQPQVLTSPAKSKQPNKKKQKVPLTKPLDKKDGDIRALFSTATKSTKSYTKLINDLGLQNDASVPTRLIGLLVDLSLDNTKAPKNCYVCQNICECTLLQSVKEEKKVSMVVLETIKEPKLPDINLIDDFDAETILKCVNKPEEDKHNVSVNNFDLEMDLGTDFLSPDSGLDIKDEAKPHNISVASDNFDIGDIADIFADDSSPEEAIEKEIAIKEEPVDVKQSLGHSIIFDDSSSEEIQLRENADKVIKREKIVKDEAIERESTVKDEPAEVKDSLGFNIVFDDSSPREAIQSAIKDEIMKDEFIERVKTVKDEEPKIAKETLGFFGLDSIDDIFADDEIDNTPPEPTQKKAKENNNTQNVKISRSPSTEYPLSPSILSGRIKPVPTSPILCSQFRKLSTKKDRPHSSTPKSCRKQLIKEPTNNNNLIITPSIKPEASIRNSLIDTSNNKSLMTITQLVDMINKTDGNASVSKSVSDRVLPEDERSVSPILLSQAEKNKLSVNTNTVDKSIASTSQNKTKDSIIILDSDSDSDSTQIYDPTDLSNTGGNKNKSLHKTNVSPLGGKRKRDLDDSFVVTASPYFNKKQKLDIEIDKPMSLQEKLALMKKNKNMIVKNDRTVLSCVVLQPTFASQKENKNPQFLDDDHEDDETDKKSILNMLQMFRRDSKLEVDKSKLKTIFKSPIKSPLPENKRKLAFDDSGDDFVCDEKIDHTSNIQLKQNDNTYRSTTNHKTRKKKKKGNEFLDMEAELSDEDGHSGDELSDDSVGSIVDFICDDDNVTHHEDIQAVYLKSIKSPLRGDGFKIPELPTRFNKQEILSQYVEEDSYEMDSFCVDSNIGLTQVHEVSELELAEMRLEQERKAKKKFRRICTQDDSPDVTVVKRNKPKRRLIDSDSDDNST